jgi:hypothetical protein
MTVARKCTPRVASAGEGYVDNGRHIARNETDHPGQDVSVIIAPVVGASAASSTLLARAVPSET